MRPSFVYVQRPFGLPGLPLLFVLAPAALIVFGYPFLFITDLARENWQHVLLNFALLAFMGTAFLLWSLAVSRGWTAATSGAGFVLMGYALASRVHCEFWLMFPAVTFTDLPAYPADFGPWVRAVRAVALFGFALGFACVTTSAWLDRRRPH